MSAAAQPQAKPDGAALAASVRAVARAAKDAAAALSLASAAERTAALKAMAAAIREDAALILAANDKDMVAASGLTPALKDRLKLDASRVEAMAKGVEEVAALPDPLGQVMAEWDRPNGLHIARVRVPLGVIAIIYESRPNVTADAAALCLRAGNAAILRGGSESVNSSGAILASLKRALKSTGLPEGAVMRVPVQDRAAVGELLKLDDLIDVVIPRGGKSLIERVAAESRIPVLKHLDGNCHTYVDGAADLAMARRIVLNAKMRRTGICGATETLLVDRRVAKTYLPPILDDLAKAGCELRGDSETRALDHRVTLANDTDWDTEYLDAIIAVKVVDGVDEAIAHINRHGSHHTEAIVTADEKAAAKFMAEVDAGIVIHNSSTQFADGGEFGMGAEIGISTGKLHARGPVGAEQLTSYKYLVRGSGQVRP
ncbi:gamma-glutamyl phosphate reductase [Hypericibacter adhaerens]|jgi:glutamate-5-semialdehyde dehydrogenase|uniref:Gamma-glutamyl phosphate reductase n=1 Tax=Hypericibacter adhaerens TaxID=2602016 RepID=A0A5J6N3S0_9PROT|nr:glutamate-5-semialdehyde dehydrogenase [Hypericibacter adhaerens]QEX24682.1 gamma-glutamyl phosphate reductase [Hypericibacter adhaerens]